MYPIIVIQDRYSGVYSGGKYTAWNTFDIPEEIDESDPICAEFWYTYIGTVGKGDTPEEAIKDLYIKTEVLKAASEWVKDKVLSSPTECKRAFLAGVEWFKTISI